MKPRIIGENQPQAAAPAAAGGKGRGGSAIVGVLAALVFICIATASMLKNTAGQSAAGRGYGAAQAMSGAASSGLVATEAFMRSGAPELRAAAIGKLQGVVDFNGGKTADPDIGRPYVFGGKDGRRKLSGEQYFSSRILDFNENTKLAVFEIESGKTEKGKKLKTARAFYAVDVAVEGGKAPWGGMNAMLLNMEMEYASGDIHVKGHSTFMENFSLGAGGAAFSFDRDDNTKEGSVFFNKMAKIEKNAEFAVPAFFNDNAIIKNHASPVTFHENVGFNKHISTDNDARAIGVLRDVWVKEGFKTAVYPGNTIANAQGLSTKFKGMGADASNLYYTDHFPLLNPDGSYPNSQCAAQGYQQWECDQLKLSATFPNINYDAAANQTNFGTADILSGLGMANEAAAAKADPANPGAAAALSRVAGEPDLSPNNVTGMGKTFLTLKDLEPGRAGADGSLSNVSISDVKNWYTKFPESQYPEHYSEGHLLVKIDAKIDFAPAAEKFNNKIAFVLEGGQANMTGKYFDSDMGAGSNASTLVYLGAGARLNMFGCNDFRGLIYMDESGGSQNQQSTFNWGADSRIDGAVLLKGAGRINWNGGSVTITKNDGVLAGYSGFITPKPGQTAQGKTVTLAPNADRVGLTPLGYYFGLK